MRTSRLMTWAIPAGTGGLSPRGRRTDQFRRSIGVALRVCLAVSINESTRNRNASACSVEFCRLRPWLSRNPRTKSTAFIVGNPEPAESSCSRAGRSSAAAAASTSSGPIGTSTTKPNLARADRRAGRVTVDVPARVRGVDRFGLAAGRCGRRARAHHRARRRAPERGLFRSRAAHPACAWVARALLGQPPDGQLVLARFAAALLAIFLAVLVAGCLEALSRST